jgi:N4-gp56 family major capsid protein
MSGEKTMSIITASVWDAQVTAQYENTFILEKARKQVHGQFLGQRRALGAQKGSSIVWPVIEPMDAQTTAVAEGSDVTPQVSSDSTVTISVSEYAGVEQITRLLEATAYTDVHKAAAENIARNFTDTTELRARYAMLQGTNVYRPAGVARASLAKATAAHQLTYDNLIQMKARCHNFGLPSWSGEEHILLIPPALEASVLTNTDFKALVEYSKGSNEAGNMFRGELGSLAGFRCVMSPWAKVYWGGATVSGGSTTLNGAVVAGATSIEVNDATSFAVGDYARIGVVETVPTITTSGAGVITRLNGTEYVQITAISGTTFTVSGMGNTVANLGLKYSHDSAQVVVECESAASALVLGKRSCGYVYSDKTGANGEHVIKVANTNVPNRFTNFSWDLIAGWGILIDRYIMRGEFAIPFEMPGYVEVLA